MNEFPVVLVINCGSSSIKFSVLDVSDCEVLMSGIADGINSENAFLSVMEVSQPRWPTTATKVH